MVRVTTDHLAALIQNQERRGKNKQIVTSSVPSAPDLLAWQLRECGIRFQREFQFDTHRKWRADFFLSLPSLPLLVEIEGGTWNPGGGRHNRPQGFEDDCEKYNNAVLLGYSLLRFTSRQVLNNTAISAILKLLLNSGIKPSDIQDKG